MITLGNAKWYNPIKDHKLILWTIFFLSFVLFQMRTLIYIEDLHPGFESHEGEFLFFSSALTFTVNAGP